MMVVGLNPSTADDQNDDPTIRRCVNFAKREGMGALCMTNVYAYRSTDPVGLREAINPVGPRNGGWLLECAKGAEIILCAWGKHARQTDARSVVTIGHGKGQESSEGAPAHCARRPSRNPR
jgi:hypothetical protein